MARPREQTGVVTVGARSHPVRDAYHSVLEMTWAQVLGLIAGMFLALNALFAAIYHAIGGVTGAATFGDAFFFSVQTMGTIGYGAMVPSSLLANVIMVLEAVVSLIFTAMATGIIFARFSRTTGELLFSHHACISPMDGLPTFAFRVGNDRKSTIFEARVSATLIRTERTLEGVVFYRMYDLELVRSQSQALARSFMPMHKITEKSPLFGATPESCVKDEVEIHVSVVGTDDISLSPVHARFRYEPKDVLWGARLADVLSELPDGQLLLDVRKFHDTLATQATATFPFPRA